MVSVTRADHELPTVQTGCLQGQDIPLEEFLSSVFWTDRKQFIIMLCHPLGGLCLVPAPCDLLHMVPVFLLFLNSPRICSAFLLAKKCPFLHLTWDITHHSSTNPYSTIGNILLGTKTKGVFFFSIFFNIWVGRTLRGKTSEKEKCLRRT